MKLQLVELFFKKKFIKIRFTLYNVLIRGESNPLKYFDEKMSKKCSTDQRFIRKRNISYEIHTLVIDIDY